MADKVEHLSVPHADQLCERLQSVNFLHEPAKIFHNKHAVHRFENVTPEPSSSNTPVQEPQRSQDNVSPAQLTPISTEVDEQEQEQQQQQKNALNAESSVDSTPSHSSTPSQFIFQKPHYDSKYMQTHFHHIKKKDSILTDLKKFIKGSSRSSSRTNLSELDQQQQQAEKIQQAADMTSVTSRTSTFSFANDFNSGIEGRYGKWGQCIADIYDHYPPSSNFSLTLITGI